MVQVWLEGSGRSHGEYGFREGRAFRPFVKPSPRKWTLAKIYPHPVLWRFFARRGRKNANKPNFATTKTPRISRLSAESHPVLCGSEDLDFGKIAAITGGIAGEECQTADCSMGTNVEIRQRRGPQAPVTSI